jgi:hypothetical protein
MALTDIDFSEGEGQDFLLEIPLGTLAAASDILSESNGAQFPVEEIPTASGGGNNIFIIPD